MEILDVQKFFYFYGDKHAAIKIQAVLLVDSTAFDIIITRSCSDTNIVTYYIHKLAACPFSPFDITLFPEL